LEDTLLAGAVCDRLDGLFGFTDHRDAAIAAKCLYQHAQNDLLGFLENSSHRHRLANLQIEDDVVFCLTPNQTSIVPVLSQGALIAAK